MTVPSDRQVPRLLWLDAARGIAAIAVMCYHYNDLLHLRPYLSSAYLAVDLFFMMSGFVLSHSYENALQSGRLTGGGYMLRRFIRLYPTYLVATAVGLAYYAGKVLLRTSDAPGLVDLAHILGSNLLFMPVLTEKLVPSGMFPLVPSSWSLATEVIASLLYGLMLARASTRALLALTGVFGAAFLWCVIRYQDFDLGWGLANFVPGIFRTLFEFTIGIVLYRAANVSIPKRYLNPALLLAGLTAVLIFFTGREILPVLLVVLALFPAFILSVEGGQVPRIFDRFFHEMGRISYPVYLLHTPVLLWLSGLYKLVAKQDPLAAGIHWLGWAMVAVSLVLSHVTARWIDEPFRAWLNTRMKGRRAMVLS